MLSETATFFYKCDNFYKKEAEGGIIYNDKDLNINWELDPKEFIISEKDLLQLGTMFRRSSALSNGAGLGIFLCKEIAAKIGVEINWENKAEGGTRVNSSHSRNSANNSGNSSG